MNELDTKLILCIQEHHRKKFLNPIMIFLTNTGNAVWFTVGFYLWLSGTNAFAGISILSSFAAILRFLCVGRLSN